MATWNMYGPNPSISLLAFFASYHCLVLYVSSPLVIIIKRSGAFKVCKHLELSLSIPHGRSACAIKTLITDFRYRPSYWHVPPGAAMALEIRFYDIAHECIK